MHWQANANPGGVRRLACALACSAMVAAPLAPAAGQTPLSDLFNSARKALSGQAASAPAQPLDPAQAALQRAVQGYTATVADLKARKNLAIHEWNLTYLQEFSATQEYTATAFPGMYALRNVRPAASPAALEEWTRANGILFEYRPITMFTSDGAGFLVRGDSTSPGAQAWIVYDKDKGGYISGEKARPYIQSMLAGMDTSPLPLVGEGKPTFILYSSPSCMYSERLQPQLEKSGMTFRIFPTYTINLGDDYRAVHRIFCAPDKVAAFKESMAVQARRLAEFKKTRKAPKPLDDGNWYCPTDVMPNILLRDLDFIFGQGYPTPSYYFADGTVISGADKLEAVRAKAQDMAARGLYFK